MQFVPIVIQIQILLRHNTIILGGISEKIRRIYCVITYLRNT